MCHIKVNAATSLLLGLPANYFTRGGSNPRAQVPYTISSKTNSMRLAHVAAGGLDAGHHLLLGDQMVDPLEQTQQTLHVAAPLVQNVIGIPGFGKVDQSRGSVNLSVDGLRCDQITNVLLRLFLSQIQQLGQTAHLNASVVLGYYTDIVLDNPLSQVFPPLVCLVLGRLLRLGIEHVCVAQVGAELLGNHRPAHQLGDGEQLQQARFLGNL